MSTTNLWDQYNTTLDCNHADGLGARYRNYIVCGMGGSHLAATLVAPFAPELHIHSGYGLPMLPPNTLQSSLVICVSYSGNTEEIIDSFEEARRHGLEVAVISTGGELLRLAKLHHCPNVCIPTSTLQPRDALGYQLQALRVLTRLSYLPEKLPEPDDDIDNTIALRARAYSSLFAKHIGLIYGTTMSRGLAYIWKITLNETGKMPAHWNLLPELNHNELESYASSPLAKHYAGLILATRDDHVRTVKRAEVTQSLLNQYFPIELQLLDTTQLHNLLIEISIAQECARLIAKAKNSDPEAVPTIEAFKKDMLQ